MQMSALWLCLRLCQFKISWDTLAFSGKKLCDAKKASKNSDFQMSFENKKKRGGNPFTAQWGVTLRYPLLPQATAKQLVHIGAKHFFIRIRNHILLSNFGKVFSSFSFWRKYYAVHQWWRNRRPRRVLSNVFAKTDQIMDISSPMLTLFRARNTTNLDAWSKTCRGGFLASFWLVSGCSIIVGPQGLNLKISCCGTDSF